MKEVLKGLWISFILPFSILFRKRHSHKLPDGTREYYNMKLLNRIGEALLMFILFPYVFYLVVKEYKNEI